MKKTLVMLIFLLALCHTAYSAPIYSKKEVIPIAKGITLTKVKEFHSGHDITYSYVKADLTNPNTSVKLLKSPKGTDVLENMNTLAASESGTVAAVNADFFSLFKGNQGFALGLEIKDGKIDQSPINQSTMATISVNDGVVSMGYPYFVASVVAPNGEKLKIRHINKHTSYFGDLLMYTSSFNNGLSPAPGGNVVEVIVEDGIVKEFRRKMPAANIPENGCVLVVSEGSSMFFSKNLNVGDPIKFEYALAPAIVNAETAFGGGAMLVSDGSVVTNFTHVISGVHPRSAIGVDKNGTTLYLVAVDGRQSTSKGMSMSELANLMKSLGCHNAVNLDGGGSTRMVASPAWNPVMTVVNSPSENRKVINAVGVTVTGSSGQAANVAVKADRKNVFIGDSAIFLASVQDENMRPLGGEITWSSDLGTIDKGVFVANKGGTATVTATHGNISGQGTIFVIDQITGIQTENRISLSKGQEKNLTLNVFDKEGHYAEVQKPDYLNIKSSNPSVVSVSGKTLKAHKDGTAVISVEKDGVVSYISVAVGAEAKQHHDDFESLNGTFKSYPTTVPGSFELTAEKAHSGSLSGKLSFDFTQEDDVTKGAYYTLTNRVQLHDNAKTISISMYTDAPMNHELRAQFIDADGDLTIASFGKSFEVGKWNQLTATIPNEAKRPLKLDRIYVLYVAGEEEDAGHVYIDDLKFDSVTPTPFVSAPINKYADEKKGENGQFTTGALITDNKTLYVRLANKKIKNYLSGKNHSALVGQLGKFSTKEDSNALYITLDTSKGGIRATDSSQWDKMASAIAKTSKKNLFILSDNSIFGSSAHENEILQAYLTSLDKNVFVITGSKSNTYRNVSGVSYFTLSRSSDETVDMARINSCVCLEFTFGETTTYQWKKIF